MKKLLYISVVTGILVTTGACEKFLEPELDNQLSDGEMLGNPAFYEGLLLSAYQAMPGQYNFNIDVASDDAVTNNKDSDYLRMATGEWQASYNPASMWNYAYQWIYYINAFLEDFEQVDWDLNDPDIDAGHLQRLKGEAYGLRAWYEFQLLQNHSGIGTDGTLLGYPIVDRVIGIEDEFRIPRATYEASVAQIMTDLDTAIANLPDVYEDIKDDNLHNKTFGEVFTNRLNGLAAKALKVRVALHAASPAFGTYTWEQAATIAGEMIAEYGGMAAFVTDFEAGVRYWLNNASSEIIWARSIAKNLDLEEGNFPPSLFGNGETNPSQELVDAFFMKNGFPITHAAALFDPNQPYKNRDPRLGACVVYNNSLLKETPIKTSEGSLDDGVNYGITSTRTGYYLKKFMNESVNLEEGNTNSTNHFFTYARWSEVFLNFAEAANEAWGPDGDPNGYGFTADLVVRAFRARAGMPAFDTYMEYFVTNADQLREVIRSERRVELCFEGTRFWDIRRLGETEVMRQPVSGMFITDSTSVYEVREVEARLYQDHMIYGPVPYNETLKYDLVQNQGWN